MTLGGDVCDKALMAKRTPLPPDLQPEPRNPSPKGADTERKIYVLPAEQVERIKAYQVSSGISSEVEAVRRLLDTALEMRDTVEDLLHKLKSRFAHEKDFRVLARDVLVPHSLVHDVMIRDNEVMFRMRQNDMGKMLRDGSLFTGEADDQGYVHRWKTVQESEKRSPTRAGRKLELDDDDDIPF
jgi:hypothetical protein